MASNADFTIDADPFVNLGFDALTSEVLTLQLEDAPALDVRTTVYSVVQKSLGAPDIAELGVVGGPGASPTPSPTSGLDITMPASGVHTYVIRCQINGGKGFVGGKAVPIASFTKERAIAIRNGASLRKIVPAESTQYDGTHGWSGAFNEAIEALFGGTDADAIHDNVAGEIVAVTIKGVPVAADHLLIEDSAAGDAKKRITIGSQPFVAGPISSTNLGLATWSGPSGDTLLNNAAWRINANSLEINGPNVASVGDIKVANGFRIAGVNVGNTQDARLLELTVTDILQIGNTVGMDRVDVECNVFGFGPSVVSPTFAHADDPTASVTGDTTLIHGQDTPGATSTAGGLDLRGGLGTTANGALRLLDGASVPRITVSAVGGMAYDTSGLHQFQVATAEIFRVQTDGAVLRRNNIQWSATDPSAPQMFQADNTVASATGDPMTQRAQDATGTTSTGASLTHKPGSGTSANGVYNLQDGGGTTRIQIAASGELLLGVGGPVRIPTSNAQLELLGPDIRWSLSTTSPRLYQQLQTTGAGQDMSVEAQGTSDAAGNGGSLDVTAGIGGATSGNGGNVRIQPNTGNVDGAVVIRDAALNVLIEVNSTGIGYFATAPVAQQTVTGARDDPEAALANLLTALDASGAIIDSTTAT